MNKKLIALAVAAVTLAPAVVMAQTANPVTLYGRVYGTFESVESTKGLGGNALPRRNRVSDNASYIGVKGVEDLGGGLNAWFQLESAANVDVGGGALASRNSAVGLQGGFGTLFLGRWDSPLKTATVATDAWSDLGIASIQAVMNDVRGDNFHLRTNNTVGYWSPVVNGFQGKFHYAAPEGKTTGATGVTPIVYSLSGTYTGGPFYAGYAFEQHKDRYGSDTAVTCAGGFGCNGYTGKEHAFFGSAVVGPFKFTALYEQIKKNSPFVANIPTQKAYLVSGTYNVGMGAFVAQYMQSKDAIAAPAKNPTKNKVQNFSVGYQYNFSKRTQAHVLYTETFNNFGTQGNFGFSNTLTPLTSGQDVKGVSVGIRHLF